MAIVYRHIRLDKNQPFYIGIGKTEKRAYTRFSRNPRWELIAKKTDWRVDILFEDVSMDFAKEKEIELIALYKRYEDGGSLCNLTKGGDGVTGYVFTEEAKQNVKANTAKGENHYRFGKGMPPHVMEALVNANKGKPSHGKGKKRPEISGMNNVRSKPLYCEMTGMFFESFTDAANFLGIPSYQIVNMFNGKNKNITSLKLYKNETYTN
jgi:hypothetical protein